MSIATELEQLAITKSAIKQAIEDKGITVGAAPFSDYPGKINSLGSTRPTPAEWVRPSDWLDLPVVTATDQKFVGLHAVYPEANFLALSAAGDFTVDWGDGVIENFAANAVAQHEYNYATYNTNNSTLSSRGYKQVIVTVTPQAGQNLTFLNLHQRHTTLSTYYSSGFLDIALAGQFLTDMSLGVQTPGSTTATIAHRDLERVNIVRSELSNLSYLFYNCYSLQSVVNIEISSRAASNLNVTFTDAGDLVNAANHGLKNGDVVLVESLTSTTGLVTKTRYYVISSTTNSFQLSSAYNGTAVLLTNDGSGVLYTGATMNNMFQNCYSLTSMSLPNTGAVTNMSAMFYNCYSLTSMSLPNTGAVTNMAGMFSNCPSTYSIILNGAKTSFDVSNCKLSAKALDDLYTSLGTVTVATTITVTGNYGTAGDNPAIATAKGWTVTG